jgi:hypothetical protein
LEYYLIHAKEPTGQLLIGTDNGFGVFWSDQGLSALTNLVTHEPKKLEEMEIKNSNNKTLTISDFLTKIEKLKVRMQ